MLRFVVSPEKEIIFDVAEKLPGFGIWIHSKKKLVETAIQQKLFNKAAKEAVKASETLPTQVEAALKERCLSLLGMARKAGLLVFGFEAVKKTIGTLETEIAFEAVGSSIRQQNRLYRPTDNIVICAHLSRESLGQITGQEAQVHVAVLKGKIAQELKRAALKLDMYLDSERVENV